MSWNKTAAESERGGNRSGAGAAPGPLQDKPRAGSERGTQGSRNPGFYASLSRTPDIGRQSSRPAVDTWRGFHGWTASEAQTNGEFQATAFWVTARTRSFVDADKVHEGDPQLDGILAAIVSEVMGKAAGARDAIMAEYGGKIAFARKSLPRAQFGGAVRAFKDAQTAALAIVAREANAEIIARREAILRTHSKRSPAKKPAIWGGAPEEPRLT
jgi:hypothetical protein